MRRERAVNRARPRTAVCMNTRKIIVGMLLFMGSSAAGAAETGVVSGRVFDRSLGEPIAGAEVAIAGTGASAATDLGGRFVLEGVEAGTVDLVFRAEGFQTARVTGVAVEAGAVAPVSISLDRAGEDEVVLLEEFEVKSEVLANSRIQQAMARKAAPVPVDQMSSADIGKFSGADAADLLRLMPGVSIASGPSGKFAVVRGLAERYNPVLLDGIVLPSPDPERQTPQLDLFPAKLMDAVAVYKAFHPGLPAFSSGGAVDLRSRPFPERRNGQLEIGLRADEGVFRNERFLSYSTNGNKDLFAWGKDDRAGGLPSVMLPNGAVAYFMDAGTPLGPRAKALPLGARLAFNIEDRVPWGGGGAEIGCALSIAYDSGYSNREVAEAEPNGYLLPGWPIPTEAEAFDTNRSRESTEEVSIGLLGVLGLKVGSEHTVSLSVFAAQNGEDVATDGAGAGQGGAFGYYTLHYKQRNLTSVRLGGEHALGASVEGRLAWRVARVWTSQEEPDYRFVPYEVNASGTGGAWGMVAGGPERRVTRYWREVGEDAWTGGADYAFRLRPQLGLRLGVLAERTQRVFTEQVHYWGGSSFTFDDFAVELPRVMAELGGPMPESKSDVGAERRVVAPFLGIEARLREGGGARGGLTLNAGVQHERYRMGIDGLSQFGSYSTMGFYQRNPALGVGDLRTEPGGPFGFFKRYFSGLEKNSLLPSAGLVWSPAENLFVRCNVSRTTARPSFREAGPYYTLDQVTLASVHGNIALRPSTVRNFDLRAEYFFSGSADLVALSLFAKRIAGAIERVGLDGEFSPKLTDTWVNNPGEAVVRGAEVEFRKSLGFLGSWLEGFEIGGNGAWIDAEVPRLAFEQKPALYRPRRRLYDQPGWIANAHLGWSHEKAGFSGTVSVSARSEVLHAANQVTVDEFLEGRAQVDLALSQRIGRAWMLRLAARNLGDPAIEITPDRGYISRPEAAGFAFARWKEGRSFALSLKRSF
jgi:hypothetical protein